jgi:hypothetical protein
MPDFLHSLQAWNTNNFAQTLKDEIEHLPAGILPLEKGVAQGGLVDDHNITATILNFKDNETAIEANVGIFFTEIVINCGCGDDPFETNAYCEMHVRIDKTSRQAEFEIKQD